MLPGNMKSVALWLQGQGRSTQKHCAREQEIAYLLSDSRGSGPSAKMPGLAS